MNTVALPNVWTPELVEDGKFFLMTNGTCFVIDGKRSSKCLLALSDRGTALEFAKAYGQGTYVLAVDELDIAAIAKSRGFHGYTLVYQTHIETVTI